MEEQVSDLGVTTLSEEMNQQDTQRLHIIQQMIMESPPSQVNEVFAGRYDIVWKATKRA
jgi:hypothetical protein